MNRLAIFLLVLFVTRIASSAPGAHGPDGEHLDSVPAGASANGRQGDGSVVLSMEMQASTGIRTQMVAKELAMKTLQLDGFIRPHPQGYGVIQPLNDGYYVPGENGIPLTGTPVAKGDVLGFVRYVDSNFDRTSQEAELVQVTFDIAQLERDVRRLQDLGELASKQSLEQLENHLETLREQQLTLAEGIDEPVSLIAPVTGVLISHVPAAGIRLEAGATAFEVITPSLRQIEVLSAYSELPRRISDASVLGLSNIKIDYRGASPRLDRGMQSLFFDLVSEVADEAVLPINQPVTVIVQLGEVREGIVLPATAVMRDRFNSPIVWIKASAERFLPQRVSFDYLSSERVLITSGLGEDNRVVVAGTALLNQIR